MIVIEAAFAIIGVGFAVGMLVAVVLNWVFERGERPERIRDDEMGW